MADWEKVKLDLLNDWLQGQPRSKFIAIPGGYSNGELYDYHPFIQGNSYEGELSIHHEQSGEPYLKCELDEDGGWDARAREIIPTLKFKLVRQIKSDGPGQLSVELGTQLFAEGSPDLRAGNWYLDRYLVSREVENDELVFVSSIFWKLVVGTGTIDNCSIVQTRWRWKPSQ